MKAVNPFTRCRMLAGMTDDSRNDTVIREARAGDRASIVGVAEASELFLPGEMLEIQAKLDSFLSGAAGGDCWLIDDAGGGAEGIAYYAPERMTSGTWNLYLLAVRPGWRGHGRGTALVRHVERDLQTRGARVLLIETSGVPEFAGQRAFYTSLGYHQEARIRDFYDAGDDKIVYWKALAPDDPPALDQAPR